jgi:GntR family transcriptional regulator, carbon starvation induced regulator
VVQTATTARSLTERVYGSLRSGILSGRIPPGQKLSPTQLGAAHGVSLNVVREALSRLSGERLVLALPQQGFAVTGLSVEDLVDLTETRELIEAATLRRSVERGDLAWETSLVAAHHRLAGTPMTAPEHPEEITAEWVHAHSAFHAATMSGCGSPRLIEITTGLGESAAIYRHWSQRHDHGRRDIAGEHRAIFDAALARDADRACRLHAEHIRRTADIVIAAVTAAGPALREEA